MPIRRRVSGEQALIPANVIEQREAQERLAVRASDKRGVHDPKVDPFPGSHMDRMLVEREHARAILLELTFDEPKPDPKEMRVQDLLANLRMSSNPGERVEQVYRNRVASPLTGIRAFCVQCQSFSPRAVAKCDMVSCPLWSFRMGRNRFRSK